MNSLPDFYGQDYGSVDPHQAMGGYAHDGSMDAGPMGSQQTLDQLLNSQEAFRRRQTYQSHYRPQAHGDHVRRASMMEFGSTDLADFQFDPNPATAQMMPQMPTMGLPQKALDPRRVRSREDLSLSTQFSGLQANDFMAGLSYPETMISGTAAADPVDEFMSDSMGPAMESTGIHDIDLRAMNMQTVSSNRPMYSTSPISQNFAPAFTISPHDPSMATTPQSPVTSMKQRSQPSLNTSNQNTSNKSAQVRRPMAAPSPLSVSQSIAQEMPAPATVQRPDARRKSLDPTSPYLPNGSMTMGQIQQDTIDAMAQASASPVFTRFQNAYSSSGFDMLGVLMRVATRPKPDINIGPVDLACAFVVCDISKHDLPIVYCSDMFERLTGYTRYEILGRNCRFLQAPDGKVQAGVKRKYVDDQSILYLKNQIAKRAEAQLSLINYRKGGQPFMNLLTMIPIAWDTEEYRFYVGFQVDLVEQPNSVSGKNPDGSYAINYNRSALPAYSLPPPPDPTAGFGDGGLTIPRDEVSQVLASIGTGESELTKRIWDKVLLENTDDVVHVLSLKGLFLYLSPASRRVLEYDPNELVGTPLSSVCHPSDIVPVTRELKDSTSGAAINVVYRIRRKKTGYTWFEAHGCLHTEQGKGRKCIILVGRERPVYALNKNEIVSDASMGDSELWSKLSTSGMFLYASSSSRQMLDRLPEDLIGTSLQALMRPEAKKEFLALLEKARTGEKVTFKHDLQNRRGQVLQAQTTVYSGDAKKGLKPTFLLAQTRLLKMTRATLVTQKSTSVSQSPGPVGSFSVGSATPQFQPIQESTTPMTQSPKELEPGVVTAAGSSGLALGTQDEALASEDNIFDELKTTRSSSWQFELRQMERQNRILAEELHGLISRKKKRKRRKGLGQSEKDCANCHTRVTPEWRRGPSGQRDLCNSCGLRWAKQNGRVSPRKHSGQSEKGGTSPGYNNTSNSASNAVSGLERGTQQQHAADDVDDTEPGNVPASIKEELEPNVGNVLPT